MVAVLADVLLPEPIVEMAGLRGRNSRNNRRTANQAGYVQANIAWTETLRRYELGFIPMSPADWQTIEAIHEVTAGGAYGFLMLDPKDSAVDAAAGLLQPLLAGANVGTIGHGYGLPTYQLYKRYQVMDGTRTKDRRLTRPNGPIVLRGGSPVTQGVSAGNCAVDAATGIVTFVADASSNAAAITVGATTNVQLAATIGLAVGDRMHLSGFGGADAALVNGLSHAISVIVGTTYTLAVNTAGKTITAGGGAAGKKYPQASEALAWSGGFYVPVHFESDDIEWEALAGGDADQRLVAGRSIMLLEVRE